MPRGVASGRLGGDGARTAMGRARHIRPWIGAQDDGDPVVLRPEAYLGRQVSR